MAARRCRSSSARGAWRRTSAPARSRSSRAISSRATCGSFAAPMRQNLALLEFYDLYDAGSTGAGSVLLTYADDTPAMASLNHGLGTLLLLNFSRQRIFQQPRAAAHLSRVDAGDREEHHQRRTAARLHRSSAKPVTDEVWKSELERRSAAQAVRRTAGGEGGAARRARRHLVRRRMNSASTPCARAKLLHAYARQSAARRKRSAPHRPRAAAGATRRERPARILRRRAARTSRT